MSRKKSLTELVISKKQSAMQDRERHLARNLLCAARNRVRIKGLPFDLEVSDIVVPKVCPVLGITLQVNHGRRGAKDNSPSLERVRPELGYVKGNVMVISYRANTIKNNATLEELRTILNFYTKLQWIKSLDNDPGMIKIND